MTRAARHGRTGSVDSVWDYPRPPALEPCERRVRVEVSGEAVIDSIRALRVLETSHPPTIYVPPEDVDMSLFSPSTRRGTVCEWKGRAEYLDLQDGGPRRVAVAWRYRDPVPRYATLRDHLAVFPGRMDACWLGDERVLAQPGDFYGGWITSDLEGPFKGAAGTLGW